MSTEDYSLALSPQETVKIIAELTSAMLASGKVDPIYEAELLLTVRHAEHLFNVICADVYQSLNERPDLFKLHCD